MRGKHKGTHKTRQGKRTESARQFLEELKCPPSKRRESNASIKSNNSLEDESDQLQINTVSTKRKTATAHHELSTAVNLRFFLETYKNTHYSLEFYGKFDSSKHLQPLLDFFGASRGHLLHIIFNCEMTPRERQALRDQIPINIEAVFSGSLRKRTKSLSRQRSQKILEDDMTAVLLATNKASAPMRRRLSISPSQPPKASKPSIKRSKTFNGFSTEDLEKAKQLAPIPEAKTKKRP